MTPEDFIFLIEKKYGKFVVPDHLGKEFINEIIFNKFKIENDLYFCRRPNVGSKLEYFTMEEMKPHLIKERFKQTY